MSATITIEEFSKRATALSGLAKVGFKFDVVTEIGYDHEAQERIVEMTPANLVYDEKLNIIFSVAKLWDYYGAAFPLQLFNKSQELVAKECVTSLYKLDGAQRLKYASLKFLPTLPPNIYGSELPDILLVTKKPEEEMVDGKTYRYVGGRDECVLCVDHEHEYYNFLDEGSYICRFKKGKKIKYVFAPEHSIDTCLIMTLCQLDPVLLKMLVKECYIPTNQAPLMKIRMEKALNEKHRAVYNLYKQGYLEQYASYGNQLLLSKLNRGEIKEATVENVKLTKEGLTYEGLSMTCPDFLSIALQQTNFNGDIDVYVVAHGVMDAIVDRFEKAAEGGKQPDPVEFTVNGFPVVLSMDANRKRFINKINIRSDELFPVIKRALCFQEKDAYEGFVKAVDLMSLQYHDVLANGIPIKVAELDWREANNPEIEKRMPRLRFKKVKNKFHLVINDAGDSVPISLRTIISRCHSINTKSNHRYDRAMAVRKDHHWVRMMLTRALIEATRVPIKEEGKITGYAGLTGEQAGQIGNLISKWKNETEERAKQLLEKVAKLTGATLTEFKGESAYKVKGQLHEYYVMVKDGKIFNAKTEKYICIINFGGAQGVGMDQIAARLLALKSDKYMTEQITTLAAG